MAMLINMHSVVVRMQGIQLLVYKVSHYTDTCGVARLLTLTCSLCMTLAMNYNNIIQFNPQLLDSALAAQSVMFRVFWEVLLRSQVDIDTGRRENLKSHTECDACHSAISGHLQGNYAEIRNGTARI
jgi:hypothetical protein